VACADVHSAASYWTYPVTVIVYIKSILGGAAAFIVTVMISGAIALALIVRFP
jgi:hypothetical protein